MQTLKTKTLTWHHFPKPNAKDIVWLKTNLEVNPAVLDELARPTVRPKVDVYNEHLYLVLHFPIFEDTARRTHAVEVDFVLTPKALITVSHDHIAPLEDMLKKCASDKSCEELFASRTPGHLFAAVMRKLYSFALRELDHIQENIGRIEEKVFSLSEREEEKLLEELSMIRRDVIDFRRAMKPQQSVVESLLAPGTDLYGAGVRPLLEGVVGEYWKVWNLLENHSEAVDALYDNNTTILNIKQNEAMRILSIMAFVTFPLVLFAQLFSMATVATPIIGYRYDFWIIVGIMLAAAFGMFLFFKSKRWL